MDPDLKYYILITIIAIIATSVIILITNKLVNYYLKRSEDKSESKTSVTLVKNIINFIIILSAVIILFFHIPELKTLGTGIFAGAGIFAVSIGFASQKAFSNLIGGVFILIFEPFKVSDRIEFKDGQRGIVEDITLRHTIIKNYENRRIIIPNSIISEETIINSSIQDKTIRKHILFSISYDSDVDKAIEIIMDETSKHPLFMDKRSEEEIANNEPPIIVRLVSLSNYSVDLKAYAWAKDNDDAFVMSTDLLKSVKKRFDAEGIEIPFPYQNIIIKKNEK